MKTKAVLFDLDGVVFDTEHNYSKFWTTIGNTYFPKNKDFAAIIKGHSLTDILQEYFSDYKNDWQKIEKALYKMEENMIFPYIDGVEKFITDLQNAGIKTCLVTSSDEIKMKTVLTSRPEIKKYFPLMVIATDVEHAKPAPDCYLLGAKKCGVLPEECVVFEDSFAGIQAGKSAGMKVIALSTTNTKESLLDKTEKIIPNFKNIDISIIDR